MYTGTWSSEPDKGVRLFKTHNEWIHFTLNFVTSLAFLIFTAATRTSPSQQPCKKPIGPHKNLQVASLRRAVSKKSLISLICLGCKVTISQMMCQQINIQNHHSHEKYFVWGPSLAAHSEPRPGAADLLNVTAPARVLHGHPAATYGIILRTE